jgi:hypothetical protein
MVAALAAVVVGRGGAAALFGLVPHRGGGRGGVVATEGLLVEPRPVTVPATATPAMRRAPPMIAAIFVISSSFRRLQPKTRRGRVR